MGGSSDSGSSEEEGEGIVPLGDKEDRLGYLYIKPTDRQELKEGDDLDGEEDGEEKDDDGEERGGDEEVGALLIETPDAPPPHERREVWAENASEGQLSCGVSASAAALDCARDGFTVTRGSGRVVSGPPPLTQSAYTSAASTAVLRTERSMG